METLVLIAPHQLTEDFIPQAIITYTPFSPPSKNVEIHHRALELSANTQYFIPHFVGLSLMYCHHALINGVMLSRLV